MQALVGVDAMDVAKAEHRFFFFLAELNGEDVGSGEHTIWMDMKTFRPCSPEQRY